MNYSIKREEVDIYKQKNSTINIQEQFINLDEIEFDTENEEKNIFIWEPIDKKWSKKLLSESFYIKDCLPDGNCQFRSIETALTNSGYKTDHEKLRRCICKYINNTDNNDFFNIIQNYRLEKQNGDFEGDWDPFSIKNKRDFIKELKKPGFNFQGDHITLSLISNAVNIDIIILDDDLNIFDLSNPDKLHSKLILLFFNKTKKHYKTIGLKLKKKVHTMFKRSELPLEIIRIIDKQNFFLHHIQTICTQEMKCGKIKLNKVISLLQDKLQNDISEKDKKIIFKIIRNILENENYFNTMK
jgi:hypothetical protein